MNKVDGIVEEQKVRVKKFPSDRIAFRSSVDSAKKDASTFKSFSSGHLPISMAVECIRKNNHLPYVTEEQFLNEYRICGYDRLYNARHEREVHGEYGRSESEI